MLVVAEAVTKPEASEAKARLAVVAANLSKAIAAAALMSAFSILVIVFVSASIDLFVNVAVLSFNTIVPVASGADSVLVVPVVIPLAFIAIFLVLSALSDIVKPSS